MPIAPARPPATGLGRALPLRLGWYRHGRGDPTTRLGPGSFARASWTPDGPATLVLSWDDERVTTRAWGPGREWAERAAATMVGLDRAAPAPPASAGHRIVDEAARRHAAVFATASGDLYHALLPTVLAQRITAGEAVRQWARLCRELGPAAPGPDLGLRLPPPPEVLARRPGWWFHPLGIEEQRAATLVAIARAADRLWDVATQPPTVAARHLALIRGVGPWTIGSVLGPALGDDDAVAVGDYHLPNMVAWNLTGRARGDDDRMLALLEPYRGQRGRVLRWLLLDGRRPPAFGPRQRILPMYRW